MSLARRAFLRVLPAAAVAGPIAVKAAADELIGKAAGVNVGQLVGSDCYPQACNPAPSNRGLIQNFFRKFGIPEFERERLWANTGVHVLDPDIAAKRSWSMSVKIATQRQRNFDRRIAQQEREWFHEDAREAFQQKHGFWFWW